MRVWWVPLSPAFPQLERLSRTSAAGPIFFINRLYFYKEGFSKPPPHPHPPTHPSTDSFALKDKAKEEPRTDGLMHPIGPYVYCLLKKRRTGKGKCEGEYVISSLPRRQPRKIV